MKSLFIKAKSEQDIVPVLKKVKIKGTIGLITTVQHLHKLKQAQKVLKNSVIGGQILGCDLRNAKKIEKKVDAFLYIGSGKFHPTQLAMHTNKPVYTANPLTNQFTKLEQKEIEQRKKRLKANYLKFLEAEKVGILVSTKPGQNRLEDAKKLKQKIRDKESHIFLFDTLKFEELENFPNIQCWVNTACPTITMEDYEKIKKPIINIDEIIQQKSF